MTVYTTTTPTKQSTCANRNNVAVLVNDITKKYIIAFPISDMVFSEDTMGLPRWTTTRWKRTTARSIKPTVQQLPFIIDMVIGDVVVEADINQIQTHIAFIHVTPYKETVSGAIEFDVEEFKSISDLEEFSDRLNHMIERNPTNLQSHSGSCELTYDFQTHVAPHMSFNREIEEDIKATSMKMMHRNDIEFLRSKRNDISHEIQALENKLNTL
ncbi:MAG: hypothetical protein PF440_06950 [Thiomicrorhabdus sp.]|jgi:hypothetical protein|nr:hypothetical protein [Thiomicrorhabdus sp.]